MRALKQLRCHRDHENSVEKMPAPSGPCRRRVKASPMIVLITGAASGIGRQIALQYAEIGATLVAVDVDAKGLACLQEDAARAGHLIHAEPCDVTDRDALSALCERLRSAFARI